MQRGCRIVRGRRYWAWGWRRIRRRTSVKEQKGRGPDSSVRGGTANYCWRTRKLQSSSLGSGELVGDWKVWLEDWSKSKTSLPGWSFLSELCWLGVYKSVLFVFRWTVESHSAFGMMSQRPELGGERGGGPWWSVASQNKDLVALNQPFCSDSWARRAVVTPGEFQAVWQSLEQSLSTVTSLLLLWDRTVDVYGVPDPARHRIRRVRESFRLEKTLKIIESNCQPNMAKSTTKLWCSPHPWRCSNNV